MSGIKTLSISKPRDQFKGRVIVPGEAHVRAAYPGATWDRLREIKSRYDPDNLLRLNQSIPPL